jgi:hypothetical protein
MSHSLSALLNPDSALETKCTNDEQVGEWKGIWVKVTKSFV